jgi:hypothetical protein
MRFKTDKQRRAMFARINRVGASLGPVEIEFKPANYSDIIVTGVKDVNFTPTNESVPDWVGATNVPVLSLPILLYLLGRISLMLTSK